MAAVGALTGVELERAARLRQRVVQRAGVERDLLAAALVDAPALIARQADGHCRQLEPARHVPRQRVDGAGRLGRQQHVTRQIEETRHLVAPRDRFARPVLRRRREIAGDDRDDEKGEQRDPVLRIGNRECADRREEEEVERQHRHQRHHDRRPEAGQRRGAEDEQEARAAVVGLTSGTGAADRSPVSAEVRHEDTKPPQWDDASACSDHSDITSSIFMILRSSAYPDCEEMERYEIDS